MTHEDYMRLAFEEASFGMRNNIGGPFGAIIVHNGQIVGKGHNKVTSTNDPTAHAEVTAIRNACKNLNTFDLQSAILYSSCEPCPMCLSAIYWANIKTVFYCLDRNNAAEIGFSDKFIYDELNIPMEDRTVKMKHLHLLNSSDLFNEWMTRPDKITY